MALTFIAANSYTGNTGDTTSLRNFGTAISNAFANAGWTQASDAGQINWTTVTANGTAGASFGSEIWRMSDPLQNTVPVYVRLDYGTAGGANRPSLNITIGSNTNGALGLTGPIGPNTSFTMGSSFSTNSPCRFSGSNSSVMFSMWESNNPYFFAIERTKAANGDNTSDGVLVFLGSGTIQQYFWSPFTGSPGAENLGIFAPTAALSTGIGTAFCWFPLFVSAGSFFNSALTCIAAPNSLTCANTFFSVQHYGATRRYLPLSNKYTFTNRSGLATSSTSFLIQWET